ncbi:MAG TPA: agmatinase [Alphaproteobacteria bacterium]
MKFLPADKAFMGYENTGNPADSKAVIIPFGLEKTVSYMGGTDKGPQAIIDASPELEKFDEVFWCEPYDAYGIATMDTPPIELKHEDALEQLAGHVRDVLKAGKFPMTLGGEHSLTPGAIRPFVEGGEPITILQFDAHADLRDGYEGFHFSHASAMCRCLDYPNVRLVSVGIRNISKEEMPVLDKYNNRIKIFWAKDMKKWDADDVAAAVGSGPVYLTFDIDGFDAAMIPATGTPEPGGLQWNQTMEIIEAVAAKAKIIGADVVELSPREGLHACDFMTAKLVYKILSYAMGLKPKAAA